MAVTEIPWGDGTSDKIYLTYSALSGNQTVLVSSDANAGPARTKDITFISTIGNISRTLTVLQESGMDYVSITWNDTCITFNDTGIAYPYEEDYIVFADSTVESILLAAGIGDGIGIKPSHAAAVTSLRQMFYLTNVPEAANISTFDELQYFTGLTDAQDFMGGSSVTKVTFPPGLVMGSGFGMYRGLRYCASLEDLDISDMTRGGNSLSTNQYLFSGCTSLTTLRVKSIESLMGFMPTVQRIDDIPFYNNTDTHYVYVDGVELTNLVIPNTITEIRPSSFYRFNRVTSVTIPNTVTSIGQRAFQGCSELAGTLTIPSSVTSIGDCAFENCGGLTNVYCFANINLSWGVFTQDNTGPTGNGSGLLYAAGDVTSRRNNVSAAPRFECIYIAGDAICASNFALIYSSSVLRLYIQGDLTESNSATPHGIVNSNNTGLRFIEIMGEINLSLGAVAHNNNQLNSNGVILHLGYDTVVHDALPCTPTLASVAYSRLTKVYVGDGSSAAHDNAILAMYLADSDWSAYSDKLDTWYNYVQNGGEYATPPTIPIE